MRTFHRPSLSLDGDWNFVPDPERLYAHDTLPRGGPIVVPGCWEAQVDRPYRIITAWYRRHFEVPAGWTDKRAIVRFGAVMYRCRAWLNGHAIGEHEGGYTTFVLDASDALRGGTNELIVEVINPLNAISDYPALAVDRVLMAEEWTPDLPLSQAPHGKQTWYSSQSGIWGSVRLEQVSDPRIAGLRMIPDLPKAQATARWSISRPTGQESASLHAELMDPDGRTVRSVRHAIAADEDAGTFVVPVPEPRPWDVDHPDLYELRMTLILDDRELDRVSARFGMRSIEVRDGRILLNGRPIYLFGALDQDLYPDTISTPPSRDFLAAQFRLAKEMGLNLLRCHIKVPDPAYLELADEMGILLWCELPNWTSFSARAARRGRETLREMVEAAGNHPSIVVWTIINEDWGTELRFEARDRQWLRKMYDWLHELDPSRLIVDNSACQTPTTPNFHLRTDIADFHTYFLSPDNAIRWRGWVADYAGRPAWLWSPHGDAYQTGHEPLVVSEFGTWGLPRIDRLLEHYGREPWWFGTGLAYYRPAGVRRRFREYRLDRIWPSIDALAEATQWHQFENLQFEIGEMRRYDAIQGYVVTEFTDANWEANGLLDITRRPKVFHDRLAALNSPDVVIADLLGRDLAAGATVRIPLSVSSYGQPADGGRVAWELALGDGSRETADAAGEVEFSDWPDHGSAEVGVLELPVPEVTATTDGRLVLRLLDDTGRQRGTDTLRVAVLPVEPPSRVLNVAVHDPEDIWQVRQRVVALGHRVVPREEADVLVATEVDEQVVDHADAGGHVLLLVRTRTAIPAGMDLARRVEVHLRRLAHAGWPGQSSPWEGDWVTSFSWISPASCDGLPVRNPLDFAYSEVLPDHVLLGHDPVRHVDEVTAGMFAGWVHAPAAIEWTFPQGRGSMTITTFRISPESGPVASALFQRLLRRTADA